jgi:hypothetical protein
VSFQILDIILYSHDGQLRRLSLQPNRVNVITGASKTGKTALIDIAEYCMGSDECRVSEGVVRDSVSWYGLRLQGSTTQMLVVRRAPEEGQAGSSAVFYSVGREVSIPAFSDLRPVTNTEGLVSVLSAAAGIEPNEQRPIMSSGIPYPATVRHASFFNYQRQDEISNSQFLFHRQGEQFIPTTIRDVLPFFVGPWGLTSSRRRMSCDACSGS